MSDSLLSRSRAAKVATRMGGDLRMAIERHPALAGIALWVQFADAEQDTVAYTDGHTVYAGKQYTEYNAHERLFIVMHELMHVALGHPARMRQLSLRLGPGFRADLYNIACDAIINASLSGTTNMKQPDGSVRLSEVLTKTGHWEQGMSEDTEVSKWSSESLYQAMLQHKDAFKSPSGGSGKGQKSGEYTLSGDVKMPENVKGMSPAEAERAAEAEIREWSQRLKMARGMLKGVMERLAGELPQVKTPWERVLRNFLIRYTGPRNRTDFTRPSRRWTSLEYGMLRQEGVALPFEPARTRQQPGGRIAVAVDTSGSIGDDLLARFSAEVAAVMGQTSSTVFLIVCDAEVQETVELKGIEGQARLRNFTYKGGGGTDFAPAIEAAAKWKPDAMVYLTDLFGSFGPKPPFPVIWAGTPGTRKDMQLPFGTLMVLE